MLANPGYFMIFQEKLFKTTTIDPEQNSSHSKVKPRTIYEWWTVHLYATFILGPDQRTLTDA